MMLALLLLLLLLQSGSTATGGEMKLIVTTPSSAAEPLKQMSLGVLVDSAPAAATWFSLTQTAGPLFSGLAGRFQWPRDEQGGVTAVKWWSEYADRDDAAHDPIDPAHSGGAKAPDVGSFTVVLTAFKGPMGSAGEFLANASAVTIHYDKSYTALRWNITATARGVPGAVRVTLTPANSVSAKLAPQTDHPCKSTRNLPLLVIYRLFLTDCFWLQGGSSTSTHTPPPAPTPLPCSSRMAAVFTGTFLNMQQKICRIDPCQLAGAKFHQNSEVFAGTGAGGLQMTLDTLNWGLSLSVPGVWFLGVFATFSDGNGAVGDLPGL